MRMQCENQNLRPSEIATLLRGEAETISAWSGAWNARRFLLHVGVIVLGAGLYGAAMGWWRDPQQALLCRHQISAHHPAHHARQRAHQRHARAVAGLEHPVPPVLLRHFDELHHRGGDSRRVQSADGVHGLERAADVAAGRLGRDLQFHQARATSPSSRSPGTTGNVRLFQLLARLGGSRAVAFRVLFAWLAGNLFLGSQLSWILRPFIGSPIAAGGIFPRDGPARKFLRKCFPLAAANFQQFD